MIVDPDKVELEQCLCGGDPVARTTSRQYFVRQNIECTKCMREVAIDYQLNRPAEREAAKTLVAWQWNAFILAVKNAQTKTV